MENESPRFVQYPIHTAPRPKVLLCRPIVSTFLCRHKQKDNPHPHTKTHTAYCIHITLKPNI